MFGVWAAIGEIETDTQFNNEDEFTEWVVGLDLQLPICSTFGIRGEFFYGDALQDWRGGILQTINITTGEEIQSWGGWGEFWWYATDAWRLHLGATSDNPSNSDVGAGGRELNWSAYIGTIYNWGGGLKTGFDILYWETQFDTTGIGNTIRLNFYIQLDF